MAYTIGFDFGTLSARCLLVDVADGRECALAEFAYPHGVMDRALPGGQPLLRDWALQHPRDYLEALRLAGTVLRQAGVSPEEVVGLGLVFTACTPLPLGQDKEPLCLSEAFAHQPHAWVKLWKHHSAQPYADRLNQVANERKEPFIRGYGGKLSSEWLFPKVYETLDQAPEVYAAAAAYVEAGDWVVYKLCGNLARNNAMATAKGCWSKSSGYPSPEYLEAVDPRLKHMPREKLEPVPIAMVGTRAGRLTRQAAEWTGLREGIPVSVAHADGHGVPVGGGIVGPGRSMMLMGTSSCNLLLTEQPLEMPGITGSLQDSIVPGYVGTEAGQSGFGDHYEWCVKQATPQRYHEEAKRQGISIYQHLANLSQQKLPGESGLVALDWWNGNRSVLANAGLSGMMLGMKLSTRAEDVYRALLEATAFGCRVILDNYEDHGATVGDIVVAGGIAHKAPYLMQIFADVTGRELSLPATREVPALSAAIWAAVAAGSQEGGYDRLEDAVAALVGPGQRAYHPDPRAQEDYQQLYREYRQLHDYFGRGQNDVMLRLGEWARQQEKRRLEREA